MLRRDKTPPRLVFLFSFILALLVLVHSGRLLSVPAPLLRLAGLRPGFLHDCLEHGGPGCLMELRNGKMPAAGFSIPNPPR